MVTDHKQLTQDEFMDEAKPYLELFRNRLLASMDDLEVAIEQFNNEGHPFRVIHYGDGKIQMERIIQ